MCHLRSSLLKTPLRVNRVNTVFLQKMVDFFGRVASLFHKINVQDKCQSEENFPISALQ